MKKEGIEMEVLETQVEQKEEKREKLTDKFVYMEETKKVLTVALKTGKNTLLFGPGGLISKAL